MMRVFDDTAYWVVTKDGYHIVCTPNGDELRYITITSVSDRVDEIPKCTAQFLVNLGSVEEMRQFIKERDERRIREGGIVRNTNGAIL